MMAPALTSHVKVTKRRGRPPGSSNSLNKRQTASRTPQARKRGRPRKSHDAPADPTAPPSDHHTRRRDRSAMVMEDEADEISIFAPSKPRFVQLSPRTRRIPQDKIDTWPQMSAQVLEQIVELLKDAKNDIVNTQRDERKALAAEDTLGAIIKALSRQLATSRAPPQARDAHLNVDKLTEQCGQLFHTVTTERHSKQLLKEQIKVARHLLKVDGAALQVVQKNAKDWKAEWKRKGKAGRLHYLLQDLETDRNVEDSAEDVALQSHTPNTSSSLDNPDPALKPLLDQLRRSLESIQTNHKQVDQLQEAMVDARSALDDVVFRRANADAYASI